MNLHFPKGYDVATFERKGKEQEFINIGKKGRIGISWSAREKYVKDYQFVALAYDKKKNSVGLCFTDEPDGNQVTKVNFNYSEQGKKQGAHIQAPGAFSKWGIDTENWRYETTVEVHEKKNGNMYVFCTLSEPLPPRKVKKKQD